MHASTSAELAAPWAALDRGWPDRRRPYLVVHRKELGTYAGGLPGSAPEAVGRRVSCTGTDTLRVADGKLAEWAKADSLLLHAAARRPRDSRARLKPLGVQYLSARQDARVCPTLVSRMRKVWPSPAATPQDPARRQASEQPSLDLRAVQRFAREAHSTCDADGRAGESLTHHLHDADGRASESLTHHLHELDQTCRFSISARRAFEDLLARVGVATQQTPGLPLYNLPFWLRGGQPLGNVNSAPGLPRAANVVVIGAGLTGASAAYHLAKETVRERPRVVMLERSDPADEASGRNGGNCQLIPENTVGVYDGLAGERLHFLRRRYPTVAREVLLAESERQASVVIGLALRNRDRLRSIVRLERIACDCSPRDRLYLAHNEREEAAICDEVTLAAQPGERIQIWSRQRIREQFGLRTHYLGRFIPGDGAYHPFKYARGLLQRALSAGVELYTRVTVESIVGEGPHRHRVEISKGRIIARRVVVATNAFTSRVVPELKAVQAYQSQIILTEHVPDRARGGVVTTEFGPTFFNQPRAGLARGRAPLLMGGGPDRPMRSASSGRRSPSVHRRLLRLRDAFYPEVHGQPPSAEWIGPMGFTPDQLPAIGFLRAGVVAAAGFNGYGGSYTTAAGEAAAPVCGHAELRDGRGQTADFSRRAGRAEHRRRDECGRSHARRFAAVSSVHDRRA